MSCAWSQGPEVVRPRVKAHMRLWSAVLLCVAVASAAPSVAAAQPSQPLPQWLPVQTLDKPFNDASGDLKRPHNFALKDCGNEGPYFICTYGSTTGVGIAAWSFPAVGLVEQMSIAIPTCNALETLGDISTMLVYILHPRRPLQ